MVDEKNNQPTNTSPLLKSSTHLRKETVRVSLKSLASGEVPMPSLKKNKPSTARLVASTGKEKTRRVTLRKSTSRLRKKEEINNPVQKATAAPNNVDKKVSASVAPPKSVVAPVAAKPTPAPAAKKVAPTPNMQKKTMRVSLQSLSKEADNQAVKVDSSQESTQPVNIRGVSMMSSSEQEKPSAGKELVKAAKNDDKATQPVPNKVLNNENIANKSSLSTGNTQRIQIKVTEEVQSASSFGPKEVISLTAMIISLAVFCFAFLQIKG